MAYPTDSHDDAAAAWPLQTTFLNGLVGDELLTNYLLAARLSMLLTFKYMEVAPDRHSWAEVKQFVNYIYIYIYIYIIIKKKILYYIIQMSNIVLKIRRHLFPSMLTTAPRATDCLSQPVFYRALSSIQRVQLRATTGASDAFWVTKP